MDILRLILILLLVWTSPVYAVVGVKDNDTDKYVYQIVFPDGTVTESAGVATYTPGAGAPHDPVTLAADFAAIASITAGQELSLDTETANYVFAGPTSGAAADPTFRALVAGDIPDISSTYLTVAGAALAYQPLEATLTDIADGTIAENLVNTANPWADDEVADTITAGNLEGTDLGTLTNANLCTYDEASTEIDCATAASTFESSTSNDLDPDRLNGDTTDNNLLDPAIVNGVKDADYGDVTVSSGAWAVEDNSHSHGGSSITDGSLMEADINWTDITNIINSGAINWDSVNSIRKLTEGGINWSSMDNWAAGKYLQALSTGGVNWNTLTATATPGGSDQQVQYNNGGSMGGMAGVNWNDGTGTLSLEAAAELSLASANWVKLPVGTGPTIDAAGKFGIDTTDDQLQYYGGAKRVIPYTYQACAVIENLAATDDSYAIWMANDAVTITGVGCNCRGTCSTTATFTLEDRGGNAMTITDTNPTCATTGAATFKAVTAGNQLTAGEMLAFDVTNSPTADDEYALCWTYTVDSQ